jgi:polyhydroxyalkanoate synthesis regulator phasin
VPKGVGVIIDSSGQLGTVLSSARFKDAIKPMDKASEAILALKPVTFHYKQELDPDAIPQFGLVAEQVEKVNPDLVVRDADGKVNTVRYEAVNAMLLNEFLKEHRQVEEQKAGLAEMKSVVSKQEELIAEQQKQIAALSASVQKLRDQVALSKPAPELVANP